MFVLSFNVTTYFQLEKTFFVFNNNHKPKTCNLFGLLSHKNHIYEAALGKIKCSDWPENNINMNCLYRPLFCKIRN